MKPHLLVAATLVAVASAAGAQSLKPGLWEITRNVQGGGQTAQMAQMQKQMASMPPAQRKMMEDVMAKQGVKMGSAGPGGMAMQVCMTREMVERNEMQMQRGDCKTTQQTRTGNTMKVAYACTNPPSSGEGQITFTSPEAYSMKMAVSTKVHGKPEKMNMDGSGKWLGADCGNIKPITPPKK